MDLLITLHGEVRWLVLLVALVALVKFILGYVQAKEYTATDKKIMLAYTILFDIQVLLGLIIILFGGGLNPHRIEHATTMIIALVVVHLNVRWRGSSDSKKVFRNNTIVILISLALVLLGVIRLRGGWIF